MSDSNNNSWAWLGLLKWSLAYTDGTKPSELSSMSEEDRKFLEQVMKNGILDENERMKYILQTTTTALQTFQQQQDHDVVDWDELETLLQELRDIVEQIDFARAFCALKGLSFLLGCVQQESIPESIRVQCLGIIATLCQNNPPVQLQLLELGSIRILSDLFFEESSTSVKAKILQALSANVRNHDVCEQVYCQVEQATEVVNQGLGVGGAVTFEPLQHRSLLFLRALVTSDFSTRERVRQFATGIVYVADTLLRSEKSDLRESSLEFLTAVLEQKRSVNVLLERKDALVTLGVEQIAALRSLSGEEREYASVELTEWDKLLRLLARAEPDQDETPRLLLGANQTAPETTLPQ
jgi:hsp70-interacting protein